MLCVVAPLLMALGASPAVPSQPGVGTTIFVAGVVAGAGADKATAAIVDERILTSLRRVSGYTFVGERDVVTILDVESKRQTAGCSDGVECAAELASALDAPVIVTGQLGKVGETWILSLTRYERSTMKALARTTREAKAQDALLSSLDGQIDELFGLGPDPVVIGAVATGTVAVVAVGAYAGLATWAWGIHDGARATIAAAPTQAEKQAAFTDAKSQGDFVNAVAIGSATVGAVAAIVAGSLVVVAMIGGDP